MSEITYSQDLITRGSKTAQEVDAGLKEITACISEIRTELEDEFRDYDEVQKSLKKIRGTSERLKGSVANLCNIECEILEQKERALRW